MQNKGFVTVFAVVLTLVCCFYLSFSFIPSRYENKAIEYANGDTDLYHNYLDSMSTEKVWLGYTLKQCREKQIGLGLDLKGGMSVIIEVDASAVLLSLGDADNVSFTTALKQASADNAIGSSKDYISLFVDKYQKNNGKDKLAVIFSTKLENISITDKDDKVVAELKKELLVAADNSFNVLRTRIDRFGVVAPNIQKLDRADRILIELPGIKEPERVRKLMQGNANLEFWKTYSLQQIQSYIMALNERSKEALALNTDSLPVKDSIATSVVSLGFVKPFQENFKTFGGGAVVGLAHKNDTAAINAILHKYIDSYPSDLKFAWGFKAEENTKESDFALYALRGDGIKKGPALDGSVVINAKADQSEKSGWEVGMQMNSLGAQRWATITGAEKGGSIAIVLDGYVYSAPNVKDKIEGGRSSISGNFTVDDAKDLENVLKSGKMKAGVRIVQEEIIGSSLGQEAIHAGMISFILAIVLLMVFMCVVYGFIPGMVANTALLLNLFITMGVLASIGAVMTLPGITGLVLALAIAVDANVLIYERTKEELRAGKNVKAALVDGYKHAFSAIFDSNLTSIITGLILIAFGTGAIQGFAVTLIIGIGASFFTAVFLTRLFYDTMMEKGKLQNLTFTTSLTKNLFANTKINFLSKSKLAAIIVVVSLVIGIGSLFINGMNKGIDFTGGRNYLVRFDKKVNTDDIEKALIPAFDGSTIRVITSASGSQGTSGGQVRITTNYKIASSSLEVEAEIKNKMTQALASYIAPGKTIDTYIQRSEKVGPNVAEDLQRAAAIAVILAVIAMGAYIFIRFRDIAFSLASFISLAHDALMVIFIYSLLYKIMPFSMEIDQAFIAAILTVVGYSINDKVVIFDRIREQRNLHSKHNVTELINTALNSTLGRTINTSLCALLVILCIFILGGDAIRSFTFAIFVGIFIGTYSSIFVATPIAWFMLKKKQDKKGLELTK